MAEKPAAATAAAAAQAPTAAAAAQAPTAAPAPTPAAASTPVLRPFHLAIPVRDIAEARAFYGGLLGFSEGRSSATWVDFNCYGSQLVAHRVEGYSAQTAQNAVDGDAVPVPHCGAALSVEEFHELSARLSAGGAAFGFAGFEIEPHLRFVGKPGEQWTMFFRDPSGNALEFKAMTNPENLFAKYVVED
jgi:extradiol dioxygenase family protein